MYRVDISSSGMEESEGVGMEAEGAKPCVKRFTVAAGVGAAVGYASRASAAVEGPVNVTPEVEAMMLRPELEGKVAAEVEFSGKGRCFSKLPRR